MSFGSFGGTSGGFNTSNTSSSLFNTTQNQTSSLFGGGGLSSTVNNPSTGATSLFGSTSQSLSGGLTATTGTTIKFNPLAGTDTVNKNGQSQTINTQHQCITAMKEYESKSLEELRCEDYMANRKQGATSGGMSLFGGSQQQTSSGFGAFGAQQPKTSIFGGGTTTGPSLFGGNQSTPTKTSFFGAQPTSTTTASTTGFGGFGTSTATTGGIFGNNTATTTGTSLFGNTQPTASSTNSIFGGTSATAPNKSVFGFGQPTSTTATTGNASFNFGNTSANTTNSIFGGGGQTGQSPLSMAKPFGSTTTGFGGTNTSFGAATTTPGGSTATTSIFGTNANKTPFGGGATTTNTFGGFGQTQQQPQQPTTGGIFGGVGGGFGGQTTTTNTFGGFGQQQQPQQQTTSIFGNTTQTPTSGLGIFGAGQPQQQQQTTSIFGGTTGGAFGSNTTAQGGSLLLGGGTTGGNSLFGGLGQQQQQPQTTTASPFGGFGSQTTATTGGLGLGGFGTTNTTTTGTTGGLGLMGSTFGAAGATGSNTNIFGGSTTLGGTTNAANTGTSLFGGLGLSGATGGATSGLGTNTTGLGSGLSLFGGGGGGLNTSSGGLNLTGGANSSLLVGQQNNSLLLGQQQQQQQQQTHMQQQLLSMSNSPYGSGGVIGSVLKNTPLGDLNNKNESIFNPISPLAQRQYILEATSPTKVVVSSTTGVNSESHSMSMMIKGGLSQSLKLQPKPLTSISLNKKGNDLFEGLDDEEEAPCFHPRKNIKKLMFKPTQHNDTTATSATHHQHHSRHSSQSSSVNGDSKVDAFMSIMNNRNKYGQNQFTSADITNDLSATDENNLVSSSTNNNNNDDVVTSPPHPANIVLDRPGYFTIPSMQDLATMTDMKTGDCFVENFAIGRVDYGCITFTGITNVANINLDECVFIRRKEVHVYPDETRKPIVGEGLNKQAEITLHRIWPTDKQTKQPITDTQRILKMGYYKKIEKATVEMDAQFVDYDPVTGSWTFRVKHFSKYGLNDDDDDDDEEEASEGANYENNVNVANRFDNPTDALLMNRLSRPTTNDKQTSHVNNAVLTSAINRKTPTVKSPIGNNLAGTTSTNRSVNIKHEKEMIEKQLHYIERRHLELMQSRASGANNNAKGGGNLNSISNQQWDILNEYATTTTTSSTTSSSTAIANKTSKSTKVTTKKLTSNKQKKQQKYVDQSNLLHLEISSENSSQENDQTTKATALSVTKSNFGIRKALILDDDDDDLVEHGDSDNVEINQTDDEDDDEEINEEAEEDTDDVEENEYNKENKNTANLITSKSKSKKKNKNKNAPTTTTTTTERIYPNLNQIKQELYSNTTTTNANLNRFNFKGDDDDENDEDEVKYSSQLQIDRQFKLGNTNAVNKQRLVEAFFTTSPTHQHHMDDNESEDNDDFNNHDYKDNMDMNDYYNHSSNDMFKSKTYLPSSATIVTNKSIGLLKRGLGGITIDDTTSNYLRSKMPKTVAIDLMSASTKGIPTTTTNLDLIEQRIASKTLKPKLWNRFLIHKTHLNTNVNNINRQRQQQQHQIVDDKDHEKQPQQQTLTKNLEWCLADAGLFNSRRFRANLSMLKSSFTYLQLKNTTNNSFQFNNAIQFKMPTSTSWWSSSSSTCFQTEDVNKFNRLRENCQVYLQAQLDLTEFNYPNSEKSLNSNANTLPLLKTKYGNDAIRQMCECAHQIRNTIGDHPDADNVSHDKMVWTLCQCLWGDIPDAFKSNPVASEGDSAGTNGNNCGRYELEQMRKRLLSEWLADVSSHRVERECRLIKFNSKSTSKDNSYLHAVFSMLTANRVMDACLTAVENGDFRLALLLSQSTNGGGGGGGGNETVRRMIKKQLDEWSTSQSDRHINSDMLKFYVLISGDLTHRLSSSSASSHLINVCENLDWKRQFAIVLWYNCLPVHSINDALVAYDQAIKANICCRPVPPYIEDNSQSSASLSSTTTSTQISTTKPSNLLYKLNQSNASTNFSNNIYDTCYHLIKLYCEPSKTSMEDLLSPLAHTSNQLDTRLSWHLAQSLDSALVVSNQHHHRHSTTISRHCMDTLCDSYASQLASLDMWHWAIFVLMHMQGDERRRESCVRLYLAKNVTSESELNEREKFCIEQLKVPDAWVYECKAMRAKCMHEYLNQFELLLKAKKWNEAHAVLIEFLAPDMFLKQNLNKLQEFLNILVKENHSISKWNVGGQIYLDYIRLEQRAQYLFNFDNNNKHKDLAGDENNFSNEMEKYLSDENLKELNHQLISLSSRLKEFDNKTPKKLLCSLNMSKLLLKYFNVFNELNNTNNSCGTTTRSKKFLYDKETNGENNEETDDEIEDEEKSTSKCLTRQIVERASHLTECIPEQDLMCTMLLKKSKYTHDFLLLSRKI